MADLTVSAEFIRPGRVGGTEQGLYYTLDGLRANLRPADRVTIIASDEVELSGGGPVTVLRVPRGNYPRFVEESRHFWKLAPRSDAYFFPNYFTPPLPKRGCRIVTTIPDLQYRHFPTNFSRRKRAWLRAAHAWTIRHADIVTVYTDHVRQDLLDTYGQKAEGKIRVVPLPVSWDRLGKSVTRPPADEYILTVASHYVHKNLETLLRAFSLVRRQNRDVRLVIAGQVGSNLVGVRHGFDALALINELDLCSSVDITGYLEANEVGSLYRGASAFVFPSLFEGFGLPPVEALGFGTHVITTKCTSLPEVTLGLAEYVDDPTDAAELASRIRRQLESRSTPPREHIERIRERYDPERIGRELYRLLVGE